MPVIPASGLLSIAARFALELIPAPDSVGGSIDGDVPFDFTITGCVREPLRGAALAIAITGATVFECSGAFGAFSAGLTGALIATLAA